MTVKNRGIFITFEGTEGAGKSTLIRELAARLQASFELPMTLTREPGGSTIAEKIRQVILETYPNETMDPWAELFLYESARAQHLAQIILPHLNQGGIVLCDRYTDSTLAYQGHARGLPWKQIQLLNRIATQNLKPDLTVLLDIDPAIGLARASEKNRFEHEGVEFQKKVRLGFLKAKKESPKRWFTLKADQKTPQEKATLLLQEIERRFKKKLKTQTPQTRGSRG